MLRSNPVLGASGPLNSSAQDELVYYYQGVCDDQRYYVVMVSALVPGFEMVEGCERQRSSALCPFPQQEGVARGKGTREVGWGEGRPGSREARTPHNHAHARDQADNLALDASIGACLSEGWVVGLGRPVDYVWGLRR